MATNDNEPERSRREALWRGLLLAGLFVFAFQCGFFHVSCVDPGFHIRTGELVLQTHSIPSRNTFSFTMPDQPWLLHQWAPAVLFYLAYRLGGLAGLIGFKALLGALVVLAAWLCARREAGRDSYWPFWAATLGVMLARERFFERPYMFSAILLGLLYYLSQRFRGVRRWEWIGLPLFMAAWANIHAGVADGFMLLGLFVMADGVEWLTSLGKGRGSAEASPSSTRDPHMEGEAPAEPRASSRDAFRRLIQLPVGIALALAAVLVSLWITNPSGPRLLLLSASYVSSPFWHDFIVELQDPTWQKEKLFFVGLAGALILQAIAWRKLRWRLFLAAAFFTMLALRSQRVMLSFAVVFVPLLAYLLAAVWPDRTARARRAHAWGLPAAWLLLFFLVIRPDRTFLHGVGLYPGYHPTQVYQFIRDRVPPQNLYNDMMYGADILWWLYPDFKPFIDSRGEAYSLEFWRDVYQPVSRGDALWREVFTKYDVTGALVPNRLGKPTPRLAKELRQDPDWALVAFNDHAVLFLKRTDANREVVAQNEFKVIWPGDWSLEGVTEKTAAEAQAEAQRALDIQPDAVFARTAMARALMLNGQYDRAAPVYAAIVAGHDVSPRYWRELAYCLYMAGGIDATEKTTDIMVDRGLEPAFAFYLKHFIALQRGNLAEARRLLDRAIVLDPAEPSYPAARKELEAAAAGQGPGARR